MNNDSPYNNEDNFSLAEEAPLLAKLKDAPEGFVCPEDYETNLVDEVLLKIHRANAFNIPKGYFEEQVDHTMALTAIESDAEDFVVTEDYFQSTFESLPTLIQLDSSKQVDNFTVPENYFDSSVDRITHIAQQNVPKTYFEELPEQIIERVQPKSRVITIKRIATWSVSFASAAAIALLLLPKNPVGPEINSNTIAAEVSVDTLLRIGIAGARKAASVEADNVINSTVTPKTLENEDVLNVVDVHVLEDVFIEQMPIEDNSEILELLLNDTDFGQLNDTKQ
jgi:hypothetical protein